MDRRIVGLDLGTNSIGWSSVTSISEDGKDRITGIEGAGSRIIPMDAATMGDFEKGKPSKSAASERTGYRSMRKRNERSHLRRERLHRVLDILGFLPEHYAQSLTRYGKFRDDVECKLAWRKSETGHYEFLFKEAFEEMLADFYQHDPDLKQRGQKIPYDWTIYYLRKKALREAISKQELAWILLNFNQKRGYYQLRDESEEEDDGKKLVEYYALRVVSVEATEDKKGKDTWYNVNLENEMVYRFASSRIPDWVGKVKEFIVTTTLDDKGNPVVDKEGNVRRSFRSPKEDDWTLRMVRTKDEISKSGKTVGEFIYDALLVDPKKKIRGGLVRTIERYFYKQELQDILKAQERFIPELRDASLYRRCIEELYPSNDAYRQSIEGRDMRYLLVDDILFYQRPLKSKKSLIDDCPYEFHDYVDKSTGEIKQAAVKCIAKSNPLFQEFRLWQFVKNIRIIEREKLVDGRPRNDVDITDEVFPSVADRVRLFEFMNDKKEISEELLMRDFFKLKKGKDKLYPYCWNYPQDKKYPCNETRAQMLSLLKKAKVDSSFLTKEMEYKLWHIMYSVEDKEEYKKALAKFAKKNGLPEVFAEVFHKAAAFKKDYGAYSEKAIKRLLPLMRAGKYWSEDAIDVTTRIRIDAFMRDEFEESVPEKARKFFQELHHIEDYQGLPLWAACYVVYGRHSEAAEVTRWTKPEHIDQFLKTFTQHTLRNPIVEQVVLETLRVVRDIWKTYGRIDEIHIEMGRELKNPADKREQMAKRMQANETANLRVKALLTEFMNPEFDIDGVRPYSPSQQDLLRIYEDGAVSSVDEIPEDIEDIINRLTLPDSAKRPSRSEVLRYKCWLEQHYVSPYTGEGIPLAKLFTPAYQIEHVIPQARFFDDSFSNKVICEAEVNQLKGKMLGYEFIKDHGGETVPCSKGGEVRILTLPEYEKLVNDTYKRNKPKRDRLLMEDIPDDFIQRQMNDSRYISKLVKALLSNVVREEGEMEATSKNVITCNGSVTDRLKKDWGVNDVWNHIILPRFQRMNELTGTHAFTTVSGNGHEIPTMPPMLQRGFQKKRIDHRHHAMDAIVIACTTRNHVNLLSNEAAMSENKSNRYVLSRLLRRYEKVTAMRGGVPQEIEVAKEFIKPWETFTADVEMVLQGIIVSFKQNLRVINKTRNKYQKIVDGKKVMVPQTKGENWAIRKPLHKETVFAKVNLRMEKTVSLKDAVAKPDRIVDQDLRQKIKELLSQGYDLKRAKKYFEENADVWQDVNLKKIPVYYFTEETDTHYFASRKALNPSVKIDSITDSGIRAILRRHLEECGDDANIAFSPDGVDKMNANISRLNGNKPHQPIYKVRVFEQANKFAVGTKGNKGKKFVEAAKGTNLFYAIYEDNGVEGNKKRHYTTIQMKAAMDRSKQGLPLAPEELEGLRLLFVLSPNDLVYMPTEEEKKLGELKLPIDNKRIYKMTDCTGVASFFVPYSYASVIYAMGKEDAKRFCKGEPILDELGKTNSLSKNANDLNGEMIKKSCIPIKVDRLGHIIEINGQKV